MLPGWLVSVRWWLRGLRTEIRHTAAASFFFVCS